MPLFICPLLNKQNVVLNIFVDAFRLWKVDNYSMYIGVQVVSRCKICYLKMRYNVILLFWTVLQYTVPLTRFVDER